MTDLQYPKPKSNKGTRPQNVSRDNEILRKVIYDKRTLQSVGNDYGFSRQAVEQICKRLDPVAYAIHQRNKKASERMRKAGSKGPDNIYFCKVCGKELKYADSYCGKKCNNIYRNHFLYHVVEGRKQGQRLAVARWVLRNPDNDKSRLSVNWAERELNGESVRKGEWLNKDGMTFKYAVRAYLNNWPIFDKLPEPIQKQIKDHVEGLR